MPIGKRDPSLAFKQAALLAQEGVGIGDEAVQAQFMLPGEWSAD